MYVSYHTVRQSYCPLLPPASRNSLTPNDLSIAPAKAVCSSTRLSLAHRYGIPQLPLQSSAHPKTQSLRLSRYLINLFYLAVSFFLPASNLQPTVLYSVLASYSTGSHEEFHLRPKSHLHWNLGLGLESTPKPWETTMERKK